MPVNPMYQEAESFILDKLRQELPAALTYHGYHHTLDVLGSAMRIAAFEAIGEEDISLLRVAIAFHDAGFLYTYHGHEEKGCEMVRNLLPGFGFEKTGIQVIENMIMATKIPQSPVTHLEKIIADADLDYLGRSDVRKVAETLYEELKLHNGPISKNEWLDIQIRFLQHHQYHTGYSVRYREAGKQQYLESLLGEKV